MRRESVALMAGLFVLLSSISIDGFPAGSALLREFGSRPTDFLLAAVLLAICFKALKFPGDIRLSRRDALVIVVVAIGVPTVNLSVTVFHTNSPLTSVLVDWVKQYGMFVWGLISYWIWRHILRDVPPQRLGLLMCVSTLIPLAAFLGDLTGSPAIQELLGIIRTKMDPRPSGLATEPSIYASWVSIFWPTVLFVAIYGRSLGARVLAGAILAILAVTVYASNARTIAVMLAMQLAFCGYWVTRTRSGLDRLAAVVLVAIIAAAALAVFSESFMSLTRTDIESNVARLGSTVTSIRVSIANPITGVGIGQFRYYFADYAPDFALASDEILTYAAGISDYRASSFNLFVRFFCEFGFVIGSVFSVFVLRPIYLAARERNPDNFTLYAALTAVAGVGFWMSQDHYGYQPGILSVAILSNALAQRSRAAAQSKLRI